MNSLKIFLTALTCLFLLFGSVNAAIVINEVELNPEGADGGNEWVELYNTGPEGINVTGWELRSKNGRLFILDSYYLDPDNHLSLYIPSSKSLVNSNDFVRLLNSSSDEVDITHSLNDTVSPSTNGDSRTWQRCPDGYDTGSDDDWGFHEGTYEGPNDCESGDNGGDDEIPEFPTFILPVLLMLASLSFARKHMPQGL